MRTPFPRIPAQTPSIFSELLVRYPPRFDLTVSNPTTAGFNYPHEEIGAALAKGCVGVYEPDAQGLISAREAVASLYKSSISTDDILLTASTSEAYGFIFRTLCAPGDNIIQIAPSYPLIEHLAELEAVHVRVVESVYEGRWITDIESIAACIDERTRAIVLVCPNNPTGHRPSDAEVHALADLAQRTGLPLIVDEVFATYGFRKPQCGIAEMIENTPALVLDGLSKRCGMPHLKLGWICVRGPAAFRREMMQALSWTSDQVLSVSTPVQRALPELLNIGEKIHAQIFSRIRHNRQTLETLVRDFPACTLYDADGGWYGLVRVPALQSEEHLIAKHLEHHGVWLHPGAFYDLNKGVHGVVSLLTKPDVFAEGMRITFQLDGV